jgi:hypothetical protein
MRGMLARRLALRPASRRPFPPFCSRRTQEIDGVSLSRPIYLLLHFALTWHLRPLADARFFRVSHNRSATFEPAASIFPRHVAPVIRQTADGERELVTMSWGFMLLQQGRAPRPVTNVRDDTILRSGFWKPSFLERRCLVPASSFCAPNGDVKPATWHWFSINVAGERPLFAFPGIWRRYKGPVKKRRTECRHRNLCVPDHHAEFARRDDQSRTHAGAADARRGIRDLARGAGG